MVNVVSAATTAEAEAAARPLVRAAGGTCSWWDLQLVSRAAGALGSAPRRPRSRLSQTPSPPWRRPLSQIQTWSGGAARGRGSRAGGWCQSSTAASLGRRWSGAGRRAGPPAAVHLAECRCRARLRWGRRRHRRCFRRRLCRCRRLRRCNQSARRRLHVGLVGLVGLVEPKPVVQRAFTNCAAAPRFTLLRRRPSRECLRDY